MKIKLYGFTSYDRSGKVRWLLEELGVDYADHWIDSKAKEHESESYLSINPLGRVPTIQIDDQVFFESGAICTYLADLYLEKGLAPSLNSPLRSKYLQWIFLASATIDPFVARIMIIEDIPAGDLFTKKESALFSDVRDVARHLNSVLEKNTFLLGDQFSTADICVSYHLNVCTLWPELKTILDEFPRLNSYLEKMKKRPAAEKSKVFIRPD